MIVGGPHKALFEAVSGSHDNWLEWTEGGDQELIVELIEDGAKLDYYNKAGNNAFHEACSKGQLQSKFIFDAYLWSISYRL